MKTICLSSSMRFESSVREAIIHFNEIGIQALFPNLDSGLSKEELDEETQRRLIFDHFRAIDISQALYVLCFQGYIGTFVTAEIGYARGKGKPVYFCQRTGKADLDCLRDGIILLDEIRKFIHL